MQAEISCHRVRKVFGKGLTAFEAITAETFSVAKGFSKHKMIVADLENGNPDVVEDAVIAAWELQSGK